ncbi:CoA-binding protein [Sulfoacidibacillus thermotolerans]|uniref:CoA-binding protein n=1 Tax=Sulfoacidibacillus thermotolerans TaxID=1765684 RepID=A0A2U3DAL0_SULT2|nr:CoA-binding protein [Sulfoacidibacillus thermotolerans]PWI58292.1 CoA-binding protein [Sulfoacidibacillus thermotolerans]
MFENPSPEEMAAILRAAKTIAVVGLSDQPDRESYAVAQEMQHRGYRIIPVNPNISSSLGEKAYKNLSEIPISYDIINVFRRSEALPAVVTEAIATPCPVIWAQQGIYHEEAADMAKKAGKTIIMDRCIMVMHSLFVKGKPNL